MPLSQATGCRGAKQPPAPAHTHSAQADDRLKATYNRHRHPPTTWDQAQRKHLPAANTKKTQKKKTFVGAQE